MYLKAGIFIFLMLLNNAAFSTTGLTCRLNPLCKAFTKSLIPGSQNFFLPTQPVNIPNCHLNSQASYKPYTLDPLKINQINLMGALLAHPLGIPSFTLPSGNFDDLSFQEKTDVVCEWISEGACKRLVCHDAAEKLFLEFTNKRYLIGDHNLVENFEDDVSNKILALEGHHLIAFDICSDHYRLHSAVIEIKDGKFRVWSQFVLRYSYEESINGKVEGHMTDHLHFTPFWIKDEDYTKFEMESFFKKYCSDFHDKEKLKRYLNNLSLLIEEISENKDIGTLNILSADLFGVSMWTHCQDDSEFPKFPFNRSHRVKGSLYVSFGEVKK